jgi:hypothetical protein
MSISFNIPNAINETECFICREAVLNINNEEYRVQYLVIIEMKDADAIAPKVKDIEIEGIPDLDDYTFSPNLSEEEDERRMTKRDGIYEQAKVRLLKHYAVEVTP